MTQTTTGNDAISLERYERDNAYYGIHDPDYENYRIRLDEQEIVGSIHGSPRLGYLVLNTYMQGRGSFWIGSAEYPTLEEAKAGSIRHFGWLVANADHRYVTIFDRWWGDDCCNAPWQKRFYSRSI